MCKTYTKKYLKRVVYCAAEQHWHRYEAQEGILYLADREADLGWLKERGLPAAAYLHEGNRDQDLSAAAYGVERPEELDECFWERIYRREKNIPWVILETERCLVREMIPEDGASFAKMYEEPSVRRFLHDFHGDADGEAAYIREYRQQYRFFEYGVWTVILKETGEVIGRVGFSDCECGEGISSDETVPIQFGYLIGVPWQRQGLATEVCRAVLEYAREEWGFDKVRVQIHRENTASLKLAERLGDKIKVY